MHSTLPWNLTLQTAHSSQWSCLPSSGQPFSSPSPGCPPPSPSVARPDCTPLWGINHNGPPCMTTLVPYLFISPLQGPGLVLPACPHKARDTLVATGRVFPKRIEARIMDFLSSIFAGSSNSTRYLSMHWAEVVRHGKCTMRQLVTKEKNEKVLHRAHVLHNRLVSRGFLRVPQTS